jgi:hypothetical protein
MGARSIAIAAVTLAGCVAPEPVKQTPEPQIAAVQLPERTPIRRRMERPVRVIVLEELRSPHEVQVARNVTAILRGMRHAELERTGMVPCEEGDAGCE